MLQAFVNADRDLGRETVSMGEYRCTDDGRKCGIKQDLAAYHYEASEELRIITVGIFARLRNAINFASSHLAAARILNPDIGEYLPPQRLVHSPPC